MSACDSVRVTHMDNEAGFRGLCDEFQERHPHLRWGRRVVDGAARLTSGCGGVTVFWVYSGTGAVFLETGHRTREGDGQPLPEVYAPELLHPDAEAALQALEEGRQRLNPAAHAPVNAILSRWRGNSYIGDCANDLWKLEHLPRPWSEDASVESALESLFRLHRSCGYSVKTGSGWEPVAAGDQLVVAGDETLNVSGRFRCLMLENASRGTRHVPAVARLRYLRDSSGGCNFDFDPFRRLPLTWYMDSPGETGDGDNFVNSHVVNIAKETSPAHFHPPRAIGGGEPQHELYLVLDPSMYNLNTYGRRAQLVAFPDLLDLRRFEIHELRPGAFVSIPPCVGHRGLDVFVNVITVPGFKPHNEFYIDSSIRECGSTAPCNTDLLHLKNYDDIAGILGV